MPDPLPGHRAQARPLCLSVCLSICPGTFETSRFTGVTQQCMLSPDRDVGRVLGMSKAAALVGGCCLQVLQEELGFTSCHKGGKGSIPGKEHKGKQRRASDTVSGTPHTSKVGVCGS